MRTFDSESPRDNRILTPICSSFVTYRTSQYKLHYYETPTNIKFVMLTDVKSPNMRVALQQIYINLYVEYGKTTWYLEIMMRWWLIQTVVKNPLSPTEHPGGEGVNNELFEQSLEQFVVRSSRGPTYSTCVS